MGSAQGRRSQCGRPPVSERTKNQTCEVFTIVFLELFTGFTGFTDLLGSKLASPRFF